MTNTTDWRAFQVTRDCADVQDKLEDRVLKVKIITLPDHKGLSVYNYYYLVCVEVNLRVFGCWLVTSVKL